ncbi:MAG: energy transducer TonB [Saprospiraceae bacterium]
MTTLRKYYMLLPVFGALFFIACDTDSNSGTTDNDQIEVDDYSPATENKRAGTYPYELSLNPQLDPKTDKFSYRLTKPVVTPETDQGENPEARMVKNSTEDAFDANEVDEAPVFGEKCYTETNTMDCTNAEIQEYIFNAIEYPEEAMEKKQDGVYMVTFTLDKNGEVGNDFKVVAKEKPCDGCAQAAVNAVAEMPKWKPAMKNGKAVAIELTLPVRFNYEAY